MAGEKIDFHFLSDIDDYLFEYVGQRRKEMFEMIENMERGIKDIFEKFNGKKEVNLLYLERMNIE